jgi:hypothetical protein
MEMWKSGIKGTVVTPVLASTRLPDRTEMSSPKISGADRKRLWMSPRRETRDDQAMDMGALGNPFAAPSVAVTVWNCSDFQRKA